MFPARAGINLLSGVYSTTRHSVLRTRGDERTTTPNKTAAHLYFPARAGKDHMQWDAAAARKEVRSVRARE
ncbi:hypothetical protein GT348_07680 [Aristophania vespae]|uniref:Uncharacterized protein n=1 Tax=Aristophania vespae TaxID=2697033 RepID=A0A6P1NGV5_9PROT|nr:hypothetical protein [Aristophania vespae]QHI96127.1 hypothetical protein GT348_07680 [Aristophania vespae]